MVLGPSDPRNGVMSPSEARNNGLANLKLEAIEAWESGLSEELYLQLKKLDLGIGLVDLGQRQQGLDQLVHVVVRSEVLGPGDPVVVDVLIRPLSFSLLGLHLVGDGPVEDNITGSLVSELKVALGLLVRPSPEHHHSLLRLPEVCRVLLVEG